MGQIILIMITIFIISVIIILLILNYIQNRKTKDFKNILDNLEVEKNVIDSSPIVPELSKVENLTKNEKINEMYKQWSEKFNLIKNEQIPKITDMLLDADHALSNKDYKGALSKIAQLEMEIYKVRTSSQFLLEEIKEITDGEEKNRTIMTSLKSKYRDLYQKFQEIEAECGVLSKPISLQFESISKRFEDFEVVMESNEYADVKTLINAIEEMIKHMTIVIEEVPTIILLSNSILPKKIKEINEIYNYMTRSGYPLDYLNVEYNIEEAEKKVNDIMDRARVLNLEDSLLELRVLAQYFDGLYTDFEKEKSAREEYEETNQIFSVKIKKITKLVNNIFKKIEEVNSLYNISKEDSEVLYEIKENLDQLVIDYKALVDHTGNTTFPYSKIVNEMLELNRRLSAIENNLDNYLDTVGSMKDDETRAKQQLDEVKSILKESKFKLFEYNLPIIPKNYYIEVQEASEALKEIVKELEKKPITIEILNTRVDTARDLALKLYTKTQNMLKLAKYAETAIVYGNRYRSKVEDLDKHLSYAEGLFYKGEYKKSLELTINVLNKVEPGIYDEIKSHYQSSKNQEG